MAALASPPPLSGERCKSVERMALRHLSSGMNQVCRLHHFAVDSPWSYRPFLEHRRQTVSLLDTREGVLLVDTTDMPKQGAHSIGVARQYRGQLGQVANCQAGMFVAYAGEGRATGVLQRLFLTESCTGDTAYAERWCARGGRDLPHPAATGPGTADRAGGRRLAACALGDLRRGLRSVDFLDGVAWQPWAWTT